MKVSLVVLTISLLVCAMVVQSSTAEIEGERDRRFDRKQWEALRSNNFIYGKRHVLLKKWAPELLVEDD